MDQLPGALTVWGGAVARRVTILLSALPVGLFAVGVFAQEKPDFTGEWTLVPEKSTQRQDERSGSGGFGGRRGAFGGSKPAQNRVIKQDGNTLTIEPTNKQGPQMLVPQ